MSLKALLPYALVAAAGAFLLHQAGWLYPAPETSAPVAETTPGPARSRAATDRRVDESAIYYYAAQGDRERMLAEIARLKALYPGWVPPEDPEAGPHRQDTDTQQLWTLFSEGRFPETRDAIARRRQSDPDWSPPADLVAKLSDGEMRVRLINAAEARQWETVLKAAREKPDILVCDNMEVLWRVAEAFIETGNIERGRDVYKYILDNCRNKNELSATVAKAMALLPLQDAAQLLANYDGDGAADAHDTLVRRRIGEAARTDTPEGAQTVVTDADVTRMEQLATADAATPDDAMLLAYYLRKEGKTERAAQLFKSALDRGAGAKAAEGYVLSLNSLGRHAEAEPIAFEWHDKSEDNLKAYLDTMTALLTQDPPPRLQEATIARFVPLALQERSVEAAQALGWYAYNSGQTTAAERWFIQALRWDRDSEPAAYGLAIVRQHLRDRDGMMAVVNAWSGRSQRIAEIETPSARRRTASASPQTVRTTSRDDRELFGGAAPATARDNARRPSSSSVGGSMGTRSCASSQSLQGLSRLSGDAALALGWCLLTLDRPLDAVKAFEVAMNNAAGAQKQSDAAYGKTLAYLRSGLTSEAAIAASEARLGPQKKKELTAMLLAQQAIAAFNGGRYAEAVYSLDARLRYAPEQTDLMVLRGWSYFHLGQYSQAEKVFSALKRAGTSADGAKGLNAVAERLNRYRY